MAYTKVHTPEGAMVADALARGALLGALHASARSACDCGCGRPERVDLTFLGQTISIVDPRDVDALIEMLRVSRVQLWGEPKGGES